MAAPHFHDILSSNVPVRKEEGIAYCVFSGNSGDVVSTTKNYVPATFVEMIIEAGYTAKQDLPFEYNGFMYILESSGVFGNNQIKAEKGEVLLFENVEICRFSQHDEERRYNNGNRAEIIGYTLTAI